MEMRRRRQAIDEALTRLNEGTYGICAECGVEISERRLEAVPFAKLCVECQAREELEKSKKKKSATRSSLPLPAEACTVG
jgi:DnaK suppressor protein